MEKAHREEVDTRHRGEDARDETKDKQLPRRLIFGGPELVGAEALVRLRLAQHDHAPKLAAGRRALHRRRLRSRPAASRCRRRQRVVSYEATVVTKDLLLLLLLLRVEIMAVIQTRRGARSELLPR